METIGISHQTLKQFLNEPFGIPHNQKNLEYESRYQHYKKNNKIKIESTIEFEKNYFIHVKIPSESQKGDLYYDVVVQFFTPNKDISRELTVENYYVQFFSNSPGFVYKYASLYKLQGYLIESLYDKFEIETLNTLPDKANKTYDLYMDSSIYYACRYILDHKLSVLGKLNIKIFKTKTPSSFFRDIQDFDSVNISRNISNLEKSLKKEISADTKLSEQQEAKLKKNDFFRKQILTKNERVKSKKSTFKDSSNESKIITPLKSLSKKSSVKKVAPNKKKGARFTTRKH